MFWIKNTCKTNQFPNYVYMKQDYKTICTENGKNQDECDAAAAVCLDRPQLNPAAVSTNVNTHNV